jgi:hypothetical protein
VSGCDDGLNCTFNTCVDGECQSKVITCNDGDSYSNGIGSETFGKWIFTQIYCNDGGVYVDGCDDQNPWTADDCEDGACWYAFFPDCPENKCYLDVAPPYSCTALPVDCDDGNLCTADGRDPENRRLNRLFRLRRHDYRLLRSGNRLRASTGR